MLAGVGVGCAAFVPRWLCPVGLEVAVVMEFDVVLEQLMVVMFRNISIN